MVEELISITYEGANVLPQEAFALFNGGYIFAEIGGDFESLEKHRPASCSSVVCDMSMNQTS